MIKSSISSILNYSPITTPHPIDLIIITYLDHDNNPITHKKVNLNEYDTISPEKEHLKKKKTHQIQ